MTTTKDRSAEIVPFSADLAPHFCQLNLEWLLRYFAVEPIDKEILGDPLKHIIGLGGDILFARSGGQIVGTCALMPDSAGQFELTKMSVTQRAQGRGIGRLLIGAALDRYAELEGSALCLETNSRLVPAIRLYESVGFRQRPHPRGHSLYQRADVFMVYEPV